MTATRTPPRSHTLTGTHREVAAQVARLRAQADAEGEPIGLTLREDRAAGTVRARVTIGTVESRRSPAPRPAPARRALAHLRRPVVYVPTLAVTGGAGYGLYRLAVGAWQAAAAAWAWVAANGSLIVGFLAVCGLLIAALVIKVACSGTHVRHY